MPHWDSVTHCEVLVVELPARLSYSWNASGDEAANRLKTVVTWTMTPTQGGTQCAHGAVGLPTEGEANYQGANYGWQRFINGLDRVAGKLA